MFSSKDFEKAAQYTDNDNMLPMTIGLCKAV